MKRYVVTRVCLLGVLALVGFALFYFWMPAERIGPASYAKLREGMTRSEVEEILGPSGDFRTASCRAWIADLGLTTTGETWIGNEAVIVVWFENGKVYESELNPGIPEEALTTRVEDWIRSLFGLAR